MEDPFPESRPVVTGPDIKALKMAQRAYQPFGQRQQGCGVHYGVRDDDLIPFQNSGQNLAPEGQTVGAVEPG